MPADKRIDNTVKSRVLGLETEYGVYAPATSGLNSETLAVAAAKAVRTWQAGLREDGKAIGWDWDGEDPLQDLRGTRLDRASAHASLLTDDPHHFAPSGGEEAPSPAQTFSTQELAGQSTPLLTNCVMTNGGRFYADHAHPEYSTPEVTNSLDAVAWDAAGELIARKAMEYSARDGIELVLYKNNTDSKGASYGSHENYLVAREIPFPTLRDHLIGFLATRPIICGAGRVGLGQRSEEPGFQISQRADFVTEIVGLQTTFNRPIVNTRDEPHADTQWRRLHVINGDSNRFQGSILAKVASTRAYLAALDAAWRSGRPTTGLEGLFLLGDPVEAVWQVSRDLHFNTKLSCADGVERSALQWQEEACNRVGEILSKTDSDILVEGSLADAKVWAETLKMLRSSVAAARIEWVAKHELFKALASRSTRHWEDVKLAALDIQWADLRKDQSPVDKIRRHCEQVVSPCEVVCAVNDPPLDTRAFLRGEAVKKRRDLVAASWDSLVISIGEQRLSRLALGSPLLKRGKAVFGGEVKEKWKNNR